MNVKRKEETSHQPRNVLEMFAVRRGEWRIEKVNNQTKDLVNVVENAIVCWYICCALEKYPKLRLVTLHFVNHRIE